MSITGFDSKCLTAGSTFPTYKDGIIRLYGMRFCPFNVRVLLTLSAKDLSFEVINIHLRNKPEWYAQLTPIGKVPVVQYNDKIVYESLIIAEWLDEEFPEKGVKILPKCPYEKAKQKMLIERLSPSLMAFYMWVRKKSEENFAKLQQALVLHEELLKDDFFAGKQPGFVDYMMWPIVDPCEALSAKFPELKECFQKCPKLTAYVEKMKARPEVKKVAQPSQLLLEYFTSVESGSTDFDLGIK